MLISGGGGGELIIGCIFFGLQEMGLYPGGGEGAYKQYFRVLGFL